MDKFSLWLIDTTFRKWLLEKTVIKYYSNYFNTLKGKTILEIGCGSGKGAKIILKYFSPDKIIATDLDPRLITLAKKKVQEKAIIFEIADATKLKYADKSFDAVFVFGVIHHIPSPKWKECLKETSRVLKPNGKIFLWDLSIESFNTLHGRLIKLFSIHPYSLMYRKQEFIDYLKNIGFNIIYQTHEKRYFTIIAEK